MTESTPDHSNEAGESAALDRSLRRSHRTVLFVIAVCAVVSALQPAADERAAPDPTLTTVAVVLALAVILMRRIATSRVITPRTNVMLTLCAYACAAALAILGAFVATTQGAMQSGLVYALAAAIFCVRPPVSIASRPKLSRRQP